MTKWDLPRYARLVQDLKINWGHLLQCTAAVFALDIRLHFGQLKTAHLFYARLSHAQCSSFLGADTVCCLVTFFLLFTDFPLKFVPVHRLMRLVGNDSLSCYFSQKFFFILERSFYWLWNSELTGSSPSAFKMSLHHFSSSATSDKKSCSSHFCSCIYDVTLL